MNYATRWDKSKELLHHSLGAPSTRDFKALITQNLIEDNPVVKEEADLAIQIYGEDIGTIKGKTPR